jgi:hypothetical protein
MLHRRDCARILTLLQYSHVAADAGQAQQPGPVVQHLLQASVVEQLEAGLTDPQAADHITSVVAPLAAMRRTASLTSC